MRMLVLMIASLSMAGCTAQARSPEPVPVDRVECAQCRMLVSSDAGSGEIVSAREETRFYDDVGCLIADWSHRAGRDPAFASASTPFVRVLGGGWADARRAWFGRPAGARTAMASGLVAFATEADARAADPSGGVRNWSDVLPK